MIAIGMAEQTGTASSISGSRLSSRTLTKGSHGTVQGADRSQEFERNGLKALYGRRSR